MSLWPAAFAAAAAGFGASALVTALAMRAGVLDFPNQRSSHTRPTPRAGGLGLLAGAGAGLLTAYALAPDGAGARSIVSALTGAGVLGAIGLIDDLWALSGRLKFPLMAALCLTLAGAAGPATVLPLAPSLPFDLPYAAGLTGSALFLFVTLNAVNFMDGSDGMLAAGVLPGAVGLTLLGAFVSALAPTLIGASLAAALLGFVLWNRPPARVFAGDAGSLAAGALYGAGALSLIAAAPATVWLAPLMILPFIADVLLTLLKRARGGRFSFEAHREHAYQVLIQDGWSHARAAYLYAALSASCVGLALIAFFGPVWLSPLALGASAIAAALLYRWKAWRAP